MVRLKRGLMFVVLILFLVGMSVSVIGALKESKIIYGGNGDPELDCNNQGATSSILDDGKHITVHPGNCGWDKFLNSYRENNGKCVVGMYDIDKYGPDECIAGYVPQGTITSKEASTMAFSDSFEWDGDDVGDGGDGGAKACLKMKFYVASFSYVCGEKGIWFACDKDTLKETILIDDPEYSEKTKDMSTTEKKRYKKNGLDKLKFQCLQGTKKFEWAEVTNLPDSLDIDLDGVPNTLDCAYNDGEIYGSYNCAILENNLGVLEEVCTQPAQDEICGNGVDEDCSEWDDAIVDLWNYDVNNHKDSCDDLKFKAACDRDFDWLEGVTENNCCTKDKLGKIQENDKGSHICLSNDLDKVGSAEKTIKETLKANWRDVPGDCVNEMCWVQADGDGAFKILTLKEKKIDVVSNSNKWYNCSIEGPLNSNLKFSDHIKDANRFYCYKEGDRYSWADCRTDAALPVTGEKAVTGNGAKNRFIGDGLFALPVSPDWESTALTSQVSIDLINGKDNNDYETFYGEQGISFGDYGYLEFYLKFDQLGAYPANPIIKIWGLADEPYLTEPILSHTILR